ncbi:MAG: hypothetical protein H0U76_18420 [Ktedonobacteraceae bacterium]|nr:hypothetical protein [Ktedonobacteraceae bacterium]
MNNHQPVSPQQLARERALHIYLSAFECGDFETMRTVLQEAMYDSELEHMLLEAHEYYLEERHFSAHEELREKVLTLILEHLTSAIQDESQEIHIPPLTMRDVFTRLQEGSPLTETLKKEIHTLLAQLPETLPPLPENLTVKSVSQLFKDLDIQITPLLSKMFRNKAILLAMARDEGIAELKAARRQKTQWQQRQYQRGKREL